MRFFRQILIVMIMLLVGCNQESMMKKMTPPEAESAARAYIDLLRQNKFEEIIKDLDVNIKTPDIRNTLVEMSQMIPKEDPRSVKVVGAHVNVFHGPNDPETTTTNITFEYEFQSKWLLINVVTQKKDNVSAVIGFNVNPIPDSLENLNKFRLSGKGLVHYIVLGSAIFVPIFTLYALILCIRAKIEKKKWLWILFILFGLGKLSVDWTTGHWGVAPLSFQLLGAGVFAPPYGSWVISISLPLGAIIFMLKRKRLSKQQDRYAQIQEAEPEIEDEGIR